MILYSVYRTVYLLRNIIFPNVTYSTVRHYTVYGDHLIHNEGQYNYARPGLYRYTTVATLSYEAL